MFDNKKPIGRLSGTTLDRDQVNALANAFPDGDKFAEQINNGLRGAAAQSSNSGSSSGSGSNFVSTIATGTISSTFGALYDRYLNDSYRFGKERVASLLKSAADGVATLDVSKVVGSLFTFIKANAGDAVKAQAEIEDKLIETFKEKGMMIGEIGDAMKEQLRDTIPYAVNLGVSTTDFIKGTQTLLASQSKFITYSEDTIKSATLAGRAFTEDSMAILQNANKFRDVGLGLSDAAREITKIGKSSLSVGLNAKDTTKVVMENLDKLNQYGFQNGIQGLTKMVQQAQSLKMSMDATFKIADKAFDPEGAIDLSAKLQVIGGAFGDFNDPLRMLYDSTNNVEGLQESLIGAASALATYNTEQGRFEVTGANLRKAKAMADAFGMSMADLNSLATKGAAKMEAMSQLEMFPGLTDDQKEFASNLAQMKDGKIGIEVPKNMMKDMGLNEPFMELSQLTGAQVDRIKKMQEKLADEKPIDIAREQMNTTTKMANTLTAIMLQVGALGFNSKAAKTARASYSGFADGLNEYGNPGGVQKIIDKMKEKGAAELTEFMKSMDLSEEDLDNAKKKAVEIGNDGVEIMKSGYEKLKEFGKGLFGSVDLNLKITADNKGGEMVMTSLDKDPRFKADLVDKISTPFRHYLAAPLNQG